MEQETPAMSCYVRTAAACFGLAAALCLALAIAYQFSPCAVHALLNHLNPATPLACIEAASADELKSILRRSQAAADERHKAALQRFEALQTEAAARVAGLEAAYQRDVAAAMDAAAKRLAEAVTETRLQERQYQQAVIGELVRQHAEAFRIEIEKIRTHYISEVAALRLQLHQMMKERDAWRAEALARRSRNF